MSEETEITAESETEAAPKPRRRRTTKKVAAEAEAQAAEAAPATGEDEAPKPRRRRTSKKAAAAEAPAEAEAASEQAAAPKPRARRTRKVAPPAEAQEAQPEQRALTEAEAAALIAAGKERAARERAGDQAQGQVATSTEPAGEGAEQPEQHSAPKRSPRRRSSRTKTGEAAEALSGEAQEASDGSSSEEAPRPGRHSGRQAHASAGEEAAAPEHRQGGRRERGNSNSNQNGNQRSQGNQPHNGRNGNNNGNNKNNNKRGRNKHNREVAPSITLEELTELKVAELRTRASELGIDGTGMKKAELAPVVYKATCEAEGFREVKGVLDVLQDGYGFLRTQGYLPSETDCYVGMNLIKRNNLRKGDLITGQTRPTRENEKYDAIQKVYTVNGTPVEELGRRPKFSELTPIYPEERLWMEHGKNTITARVIDLVAPIGKGQRGLIVSPPKAGKTTVLKDIAASISANNPEVHLMCLLIDERPEEVTDMERSIKGEVVASTFDMPADNHITVSELVIERAKRLVENGEDVVILLDSITRLARAYNLAQPASGRVLSGGVDSTALYPPKRFFGAARNIENGGSLTILATGLVETGSKMDEVIFEEFKGTGNMELRLDRALADRRIYPAIDPVASSTRKEELLVDSQVRPLIWAVRRILANMNNTERAMDMLIKSIKKTENNQEFLLKMARKAQHSAKDALEI